MLDTTERNRAPHFPSMREIINRIHQANQALMYVHMGYRPFAYSYFFDDHYNGNRTGPMMGVIWARDEEDAMRHVGVDRNGCAYGYERVVTPMEWENDSRAIISPEKPEPEGLY